MSEKIIIDTDPGIDDAMAIFMALQATELEVLGLTTIFGNVDVNIATANAISLCDMAAQPIPVTRGMAMPWVGPESSYAYFVHGDNGMGNVPIAAPSRLPDPRPAAQFLIDMAKQYPGEVTVVAIGPLGNLAMALRLEPNLPQLLKRVVVMGGAARTRGNVSPVAEANIWNDPFAADIVFQAGWDLTMVGLDVTYSVSYDQAFLQTLADGNPKLGGFIQQIAQYYLKFYSEQYQQATQPICYFHDAMAIAQVLDPSLFHYQTGHIRVATDAIHCGQTSFANQDDKMIHQEWQNQPLVQVAMAVDGERLNNLLLSTYRQ